MIVAIAKKTAITTIIPWELIAFVHGPVTFFLFYEGRND